MRTISGVIAVMLVLVVAMAAACSSSDDKASSTPAGLQSTTTTAAQTSTVGSTSTKTPAAGASTQTSTAAASATSGSSNGNAPVEACDLMTIDDVAAVVNISRSDLENDSLGKQIPPVPFTSGVQCQYNDVVNFNAQVWLYAQFAPSSAGAAVKQSVQTECGANGKQIELGDFACYPQFAGQLRVARGSTQLIFFLYSPNESQSDEQAGMKTLAEKALSRLP